MNEDTTETNKFPSWRTIAATLLSLLVVVGLAVAQSVYDSARPGRNADGTAPTWYRTGLTGTDSRTDPSGLDAQAIVNNDAWVRVDARGSVPGATAQLMLWTGGVDGVLDVAEIITVTFSADVNPNSDGYQPTSRAAFSVAGDAFYAVGVPDVSEGTVDVKARTVGNGSRAAEAP